MVLTVCFLCSSPCDRTGSQTWLRPAGERPVVFCFSFRERQRWKLLTGLSLEGLSTSPSPNPLPTSLLLSCPKAILYPSLSPPHLSRLTPAESLPGSPLTSCFHCWGRGGWGEGGRGREEAAGEGEERAGSGRGPMGREGSRGRGREEGKVE